jgi:hypothetical protein
MLDTELVAQLTALGIPASKARSLTADIRDTLHPIAAVAARMLITGAIPAKPAPGLGAGVTTALSYGSTAASVTSAAFAGASAIGIGAAAGSVVPVVGTIIGAVVGAVAGMVINTGQKPQRQAEAIQALAQLQKLPSAYLGRTISDHDMHVLFMALFLADGWLARDWLGTALTNHPSAMGNWTDLIMLAFKNAITAAKSAPVGASLTIQTVAGDKNGPYTFTNPGLDVSLGYVWAATVMMPMISMFAGWHSASPTARAEIVGDQNALHVLSLLYDYTLAQVVPQSTSVQLAVAGTATVPVSIAQQAALAAMNVQAGQTLPGGPLALSAAGLNTQQILTAQLLQQSVATNSGVNLTSPAAQNVLAQVATTGVQSTPAGPSSLPTWAIPVGFGVAGLLLK